MAILNDTEQPLHTEIASDSSTVEHTRRWPRRLAGGIAAAGVGLLAATGANLMFRNNNMQDFEDLRWLTSAEGQEARCGIDSALDGQEQMRLHFEEQGGVPEGELPLVSDFVGLEPETAQGLLEDELYRMPMDCDVATASSNEATQGIIMVTAAASLTVGALSGAAFRVRRG